MMVLVGVVEEKYKQKRKYGTVFKLGVKAGEYGYYWINVTSSDFASFDLGNEFLACYAIGLFGISYEPLSDVEYDESAKKCPDQHYGISKPKDR